VAAAAIIGFALVEPRRTEHPSIDYAGAATLTAAVTLLMLALVEGGDPSQLLRPRNIAIFLTTAALVAAFVAIERRAREPIIPLDLLRNRVVAVAVIVGFLSGAAMFGAISFIPLFAQGGLGATATQAGTLLTPLMLSWVLMSIVGGRLMLRTGYRLLVLIGLTIMPIAFFVLSTFGRGTSLRALIPVLAGIGAGLGLVMLTLLIAVQHSVPRERLGIATSLNQFFRSIGGAVGVAIMGAMLSAGLAAAAGAGAIDPGSLVDPVTRASLAPEQLARLEGALIDSLQDVFRISGIVSLIALAVAFTLPRDTHKAAVSEAGDGERMVMAEMTTIDPEHEPCCGEDGSTPSS
jgi:MFS family permease